MISDSTKADTWMPLLVAKYLADTMHLSTEQHGAYLLLLMHGWMNRGALPIEDEKLRRITRMSPKSWAEQRDDIKAFFTAANGQLRQKRLDIELVRWSEMKDRKSAAGRAAGLASAAKRAHAQGGNERSTDVEPTLNSGSTNGQPKSNPTPTPLPSEDLTVAGATDAEASKVLSAKERVWLLGRAVLGDKGRTLLGKLVKQHSDEIVADVLAAAHAQMPIQEPKAWVVAACDAAAKRKPQAAPTGDAKPKWALDAGFQNRFEAENDGCFSHNASAFSNGKRKDSK